MRFSQLSFAPLLGAVGFMGLVLGFVGCGDGGSDDGSCSPGSHFCACLDGQCMDGLVCASGFCLSASGETGADGESGDGDGDGDSGDGDGDSGDGDGDGDSGDGDGDSGDGDGDGDSGDGDGDSGDGDGDGEVCEGFPISLTPSDVMFVVDASGSMVNLTWNHDADGNTPNVTRWYSLHAVLEAALSEYAPLLNAGVKRFPSSTATGTYQATACDTSLTPEANMDVDNANGVMAVIPPQAATSAEVKGGTPTTKGIDAAVSHILDQGIANSRSIVLMTDGAANCNTLLPFPNMLEDYDLTLAPTIEDAYLTHAITTHVLGIAIVDMLVGVGMDGFPHANPYVTLNDAAVAGGAPLGGVTKFHSASTQAELATALETVLDPIACVVDLTRVPEGPPMLAEVPDVGLEIDGAPIPHVLSCAAGNGWTWAVEGEQVRFCGTYCEDFKANLGLGIDVDYCD